MKLYELWQVIEPDACVNICDTEGASLIQNADEQEVGIYADDEVSGIDGLGLHEIVIYLDL